MSVTHSAAQTTTTDEVEWQVIVTDDFTLSIPNGWEQKDDPKTEVTCVAPASWTSLSSSTRPFLNNIRIQKFPLDVGDNVRIDTVDQALSIQERSITDSFHVIGSGIHRENAPRIAWLATSEKLVPPGQERFAKIDYMMVHRGSLYVMFAMCPAGQLEDARSTFDSIADSFAFTLPDFPADTRVTQRTTQSSAFEDGKVVGKLAARAMIVAIAISAVIALIRRIRGRSKS